MLGFAWFEVGQRQRMDATSTENKFNVVSHARLVSDKNNEGQPSCLAGGGEDGLDPDLRPKQSIHRPSPQKQATMSLPTSE